MSIDRESDPFISFAPPDVGEAEIAAVVEVLRSGWLTTGPRTAAFERDFAAAVRAPGALALNSGTAAMHLALAAMGIGPGDEVIVPTMTFCSTALVVEHVGATPVAVDVAADTLNLEAAAVVDAITPRTRAVIAVHYAGHPVDLDALGALCRERGLVLLEDAAHATGARWRGIPIGGHGHPAAFSFYATKNLVCGEGGMLTGDDDLLARARTLALHGMDRDAWKRYDRAGSWRYDVVAEGYKYNMADLQAAIGGVQLQRLEALQSRREEIVARYRERLADCELLELPAVREHAGHAWHLFPIRLRNEALHIDRDAVFEAMKAAGIGCSVHFIPLHRLAHFAAHGWARAEFPVAEEAFARLLSLPLHTRLSDADVDRVAGTLRELLERHRR